MSSGGSIYEQVSGFIFGSVTLAHDEPQARCFSAGEL